MKNLKKIILAIAAVTLMAYNSSAQDNGTDHRGSLQLGLKIGANLSNVYDSQGEQFNADGKFGLAAGAFLEIPIGKYLGIQPELLFSQKGFQATGSLLGTDYKFTRTTNFIDIPLFIQLKPSNMVTLLAGPQFSYLMKQRDEFPNATIEEEFKNDNIRKNIMCFVIGVDINPNRFVFGARAGWDVQENNGDGTSTTPRYKNVWYQATVGFRF